MNLQLIEVEPAWYEPTYDIILETPPQTRVDSMPVMARYYRRWSRDMRTKSYRRNLRWQLRKGHQVVLL